MSMCVCVILFSFFLRKNKEYTGDKWVVRIVLGDSIKFNNVLKKIYRLGDVAYLICLSMFLSKQST